MWSLCQRQILLIQTHILKSPMVHLIGRQSEVPEIIIILQVEALRHLCIITNPRMGYLYRRKDNFLAYAEVSCELSFVLIIL